MKPKGRKWTKMKKKAKAKDRRTHLQWKTDKAPAVNGSRKIIEAFYCGFVLGFCLFILFCFVYCYIVGDIVSLAPWLFAMQKLYCDTFLTSLCFDPIYAKIGRIDYKFGFV